MCFASPKPTSSVIMSRMFGALFGGTIRAGQAGLDCRALSSIEPPNGGGGAGRYLPSIVVVALGEPGVPVVCCWALTAKAVRKTAQTTNPLEGGAFPNLL